MSKLFFLASLALFICGSSFWVGVFVTRLVRARVESREQAVRILYKNWRGETAWRHVTPRRIEFVATRWHPDPQWVVHAWDHGRGAERSFALRDVQSWGPRVTS